MDVRSPEFQKDAAQIQSTFTALVAALTQPQTVYSQPINDLMKLAWELVGRKIVPCAVGETPTNTMAFMVGIPPDKEEFEAMIICPPTWHKQVEENVVFCAGGLVYNASKACDFYNGKYLKNMLIDEDANKRAMAFEAEFYHNYPNEFEPDAYQKTVMETYPRGVEDIYELLYKRKPLPETSDGGIQNHWTVEPGND